jgi:hypothetical protein
MSSSAFFSSIADRSINANASFNNNTFDVIKGRLELWTMRLNQWLLLGFLT